MTPIREHIADGIAEYDNPLPRWWMGMFFLSMVFAVIYGILYPSLPGYAGTLGWSSARQYDQQVALALAAHPPPDHAVANPAEDLEKLSKDPKMVAAGREIFEDNCVLCHGEHAEGKVGPNLHGPHFRYGGDSLTILTTIREGRKGGMPTWKKFFENDDILKVGSYVYSLRYDPDPKYRNDGTRPDVPRPEKQSASAK